MTKPVAAARRYAEAAFQVALAEDRLDAWKADLALAADILGRPEVVEVVGSPALPLERRLAVTDGLLRSRISPAALRLVNLLVQRGRASVLPRLSEDYTRQLNAQGLYRGQAAFEAHGIFHQVTRPRCAAAITGRDLTVDLEVVDTAEGMSPRFPLGAAGNPTLNVRMLLGEAQSP